MKTVKSEICQMAAVKIDGKSNAQAEKVQKSMVEIPSFIARRLENQEIQG